MKTKIEFPKVMSISSWSRSDGLRDQQKQQIEIRREFWNSLFKEWGYKKIVWPKESYWDTLTLDGVLIHLKGWNESGRCYIRQNSGNEGIWSFFEIDKPVDIEKVKNTVKKIWDAVHAEKVKEDTEENTIAYNKTLLPEGIERFSNRRIVIVVEETCFEVNIDYDYTFTFDLSGDLIKFSTVKTFSRPYGKTSTEAFAKLRKEIDDYEVKVTTIEKELVGWFSGIKN